MIEIGQRKGQEREEGDSITGRGSSKGERNPDDWWEVQWRAGKSPKGGWKDKQQQSYGGFVKGTKYFKGELFQAS